MRGLLFLGDRRAELHEVSDPEPGPGEVVVALRASGLCGSDLHLYRETEAERSRDLAEKGWPNAVPGHEPAGIVDRVGPGVSRIQPGDRVAVYHYRGCGFCRECQRGQLQFCGERRGYGGPVHGADADFILTDARNCIPLPESLPFSFGAMMACNVGTAFSALSKIRPNGASTLVVVGQGPVGLAGTLLARAMGARVIALEPVEERRRLALELGAAEAIDPRDGDPADAVRRLTGGAGADFSFETSGTGAGQNAAVAVVRTCGTAVFVGLNAKQKVLCLEDVIYRQLTLQGSYVLAIDQFYDMVRFVMAHRLPLDAMVTHRFPLDRAVEAFALFDQGKTGKVLFEW